MTYIYIYNDSDSATPAPERWDDSDGDSIRVTTRMTG